MTIAIDILRILALLVSIFFLYVSIFLYENEEGKIQNMLENTWMKITDYKKQFLSKQTVFLKEIAGVTDHLFKRLFGERLFSWRSIAVSACYSVASICLITSYRVYSADQRFKELVETTPPGVIILGDSYANLYGNYLLPVLVILIPVFLILGTLPFFIKGILTYKVWFTIVLISVILFSVSIYLSDYSGLTKYYSSIEAGSSGSYKSLLWEVDNLIKLNNELINRRDFIMITVASCFAGIFFSFLASAFFIAATRKILQWATGLDSFMRILSVIVLNFVLALILCFGPAFIGFGLAYLTTGHSTGIFRSEHFSNEPDLITSPYSWPVFAFGIQQAGFLSSLGNIMTSLFAGFFILTGIVFILHKLMWPVIERTVYALQGLGIARRKKLFSSLGLLLLGLAYGKVPSIIKEMVELFI